MMKKKQKMLYLVNRKILKEQIDAELRENVVREMYKTGQCNVEDIPKTVEVMTYQYIEEKLKINKSGIINKLLEYDIVVYDECHYLYTDASFNTNTELSYDCLRDMFRKKTEIFMSATMDKMEKFIKNRTAISFNWNNPHNFPEIKDIKKYEGKADYGNIALKVIENEDVLQNHIKDSMENGSSKWLIFVDNINAGKRLKQNLMSKEGNISENDVIFIDADYKKDEQAWSEVKNIVERQCSEKRIVISTAVMDNGISFHDINLRNLVILADTEDMFLQMLGRKREDSVQTNVFIFKRDKQHFVRRHEKVKGILKFYQANSDHLKNYLPFQLTNGYGGKEANLYDVLWYSNKKDINKSFLYENCCFNKQFFLDNIFSNEASYKKARKFCYSASGVIGVNSFAIERYRYLDLFYNDIIQAIEKDENAFVKMQASWLGKQEDEVQKIILQSEQDKENVYRDKLAAAVLDMANKEMSKAENIKWKMDNKEALIYFYQKDEKCTEGKVKDFRKTDRALTADIFNICMEQAGLPYKMSGRGKYIIESIDENKKIQDL